MIKDRLPALTSAWLLWRDGKKSVTHQMVSERGPMFNSHGQHSEGEFSQTQKEVAGMATWARGRSTILWSEVGPSEGWGRGDPEMGARGSPGDHEMGATWVRVLL